jgi:hypothetical protein
MAVKETALGNEAAWPTRGSLFLSPAPPPYTLFKAFWSHCQLSWHGSYFFTSHLFNVRSVPFVDFGKVWQGGWYTQACCKQHGAWGRGVWWEGCRGSPASPLAGVAKSEGVWCSSLCPDVVECILDFFFFYFLLWCW